MTIISSTARNAYPGDQVRIMRKAHTDADGRVWGADTEYTPLSIGVDNTFPGANSVQVVMIGSKRVEFVGRANANR